MWPPTSADVARLLRIRGQTPDDATVLDAATAAAIADVQDWRSDLFDPVNPSLISDNVFYGTTMYAANLYARRANTTGVDPVTGLGQSPDYAMDATVARLLGIGHYAKPRVG